MLGLSFDRITFNYGTDPIFSDLTWEVHDDRVVGLIGPNGCGKSTLLRLMAGEIVCDSGAIARRKGITIGFLHQEPQLDPGRTVWQVVFSSFTRLWKVEEGLGQIERALTDPKIYGDAQNLAQILEKQQKLLYEFDQLGGTRYEGLVRSILHSLGFSDSELLLPVEVLSGGQRKLAALARLLVNQPDMLLLDEPDNHLDLKAKTYLERLIRNYAGGVVIVSHDRYLLDLVVDEIVELEDGRLTGYPGNYSEYAFEKQMRMQRQQQMYQAQQKEITRLEQAAKRLLMWGEIYDNNKFSRRGKSILKNLEKVERFDKPVLNRKRMGLELAGWVGSNKVLEIVDLYKSFPSSLPAVDETIILGGINLLIRRGERVGLVGPNGAGKSLLFRLLLDQESPSAGEIAIGPSIKVGYYAQQHETLNYQRTLLETVQQAGNFSEERGVSFLKRFLFGYRQAHELVATLSGGERSRLQMALLMLSGANFLLLDEPTNNLDISSTEVLENALDDFEGTLLVISHDRYFLDRVVERIEDLNKGQLKSYPGNYSDYIQAGL